MPPPSSSTASLLPVASPRTAKELLATLQTEMSAMEATKESSSETAGGAATASTTGIAASSVYGCWVTWMRLEILQRGVLWTHGMTESSSSSSSSTPAVTNDEEKELDDARHLLLSQLLAAVQAVAGKALLFQAADGSEAEPSTLPRPLLASAAALQAKVAEQVARHFRVQHPRTDNDSTAASTSHPVSSEAQLDRLQELLFRIHTTSTTTATGPKSPKKTHPRPDNPNSLVATVLERCRQVHDERFLLALQLVTEHKTGGTTSFHNNANDSSAAASATTVAIHDAWLILAQGGYYRAAACQPNAPPLWKRAWETEQQLQVTTVTGGDHASRTTTTTASTMNTRATTRRRPHWESHHALPALQALIRIATSKGNAKRVAELTLRLASAWLHAAAAGASPSSTANTPLPFQQRLTDVFVTPVRHLPPDVTRPRAALAHAAASLAQTATTNLPAATNATEAAASAAVVVNQWYHDVLTLDLWVVQHQVGLAEAVAANARAQPALLAKRTSSQPERTTATVAATAYWRDQWKQRTIHENSGTDADHRPHVTEEEVYATVERLVHVLHGSNGSDKPESSPSLATHHDSHLVSAAWLAIEDVCTYQYEYLCAVSASFDDDSMPPNTNSSEFTTGWQLLAMLLSTIWTRLAPTPTDENNPEDLTSAPQWAFWETLSHLVCRLAWATLAWHMEAPSVWSLSPSLWQQIHWALSSALDQSKIQSSSQTQVALSSQWQPAQIQSLRLRVARLAAQCWRLLNSRDRLELQDIAHVTRDLIILSNHGEVFVALDADYGASLLASLLAWSGFFRTPWEFAIASEGRILLQTTRSVMKRAHSQWGRISHPLEDLLLFIAEGDLETHGGLVDKARKLYEKVTTSPCLGQGNGQSTAASILTARCHLGLAKLAALNSENSSSDLAFKSLEILKSLPAEPTGLLMWKSPLLRDLAVQSQIVVSKQLIADHLIQLGKMREAGDFLESCVKDAPTDEVASFTFGAYLLRMVFFQGHDSSESLKRAQTQLLKAAKLNPHMASPFALLGYLYESKNDLKRATGCYSKALSLEPFHPVAGRGMIRLTDDGAVQPIIDNAINCVSSLNGWAWHYVGHAMLQKEGKDELAISALLKATRSRDIDDPSSDPLSIFYSGPEFPAHPSQINHIHSLQDLALCYRRLGRCSAELRTLQAALELSGESPSWSLLQACAQAEMEMGLIEDAEQKFKRAASVSSGAKSKVSLGAHGMVAFMMGRRDWQDGKVGVALSRVMEAIEQCAPLAQNSSTLSRLVGDMHSFLAVFPSELFQKQRNREEANDIFKSQLEIIARGMEYYNSSLSIVEQSFPSDESMSLRADLVCDKAVNILLRAQLWAQSQNMSQKDCRPDQEVMDLFSSAQECFEEALQIDPLHAVAWCGMGCSLVGEPLKAQHAFCRAIELDSSSPDSYANLGFLYMERNAMSQGAEVCDRLTQVADTQMTWINRALQIEAGMPHADSLAGQGAYVEQLSDAYRAALQLQRDSFALIGLAASFRIMSAAGRPSRADTWENGVLIQEYQSFTSSEYPLQVALPQKDGDASDHDFTDSVNAAKHAILTRPDDGNAWLALSKRLLLDSSDGRDDYSTSSARVAAERARRLFLETLTNHVGNKITRAPASQVSDALALVSWLNSSTSIEQPTSPCSKEAQLALLICPRNTLARAFVERNTQ